ncbi:hypothetical protein [Photobacterium kishitanii]|uniref:Uncharacterized protein n=1 Tax=Photobacterium kishitanii TaxID=318456 RepID=A0A2T3KLG3_9GAMM|nr:hypothetical protein [Photobacterium kishitanii]PSV00499.1 hypothetical protein C9J27_05025 [Photobacterium kishitanii]
MLELLGVGDELFFTGLFLAGVLPSGIALLLNYRAQTQAKILSFFRGLALAFTTVNALISLVLVSKPIFAVFISLLSLKGHTNYTSYAVDVINSYSDEIKSGIVVAMITSLCILISSIANALGDRFGETRKFSTNS